MRRSFALFALLSLSGLSRADAPKPEKLKEIGSATTVDRLKADMKFLASEDLAGRCTGSPEIEKAADFIAAEFKKAGLQPCGKDGTWFQPFTFNYGSPKLGTPTTLTFDVDGKETKLKYAAEFNPTGMSPSGKAKAGVAFVGYGMSLKDPAYDDYAGIDVKGKIVIILRRAPKWDSKDNPFQKGDNATAAALIEKADLAAKKGAAAVIFVNDTTFAAKTDELIEFRRDVLGTTAQVPLVHVKRASVDKLLAADDTTLDKLQKEIEKTDKPQSFVLKNATADVQVTIARPVIDAKNVVGTLPGSGPLADEVIVIGAHYDHVGRNEHSNSAAGASAKGKIHYGADDNASGTCGLLELVRRFGAMKERQGRRIVFIAFTGEELGLYGSKQYCKEPSFPLEKTVFMLNMDMIGRSKVLDVNNSGYLDKTKLELKDRLVVYGHATGEGLESLVDSTLAKFDFKVFKVPGGTGPSDHDSFYKKNVPVLFFFTGTHKDYHTPTDTWDKINYRAMAKVVDLVELFAGYLSTTPDKFKYVKVAGGWEDPTEERPRSTTRNLPRLGITPGNYGEEDKGVLVDDVAAGGAAEKAGIKGGDLIVEIAGKPVKNMETYMSALATQKVGTEIDIVVLRDKERKALKITPTGPKR